MAKNGEQSSNQDIEKGHHTDDTDSDEDSLCFSDAQENSWHSPSGAGSGQEDRRVSSVTFHEIDRVREEKRKSSELSSAEDDLESGKLEVKVDRGKSDPICRICHLSLEKAAAESGIPILLGCSCKNDLASAHKQCAERWFKIRGNKTCEICGSTACNVVISSDAGGIDQQSEGSASVAPPSQPTEIRSFLQGHRFLKFLLACLVLAFVISWLFHLNIRSKYGKLGRENGKAVSYHFSISP